MCGFTAYYHADVVFTNRYSHASGLSSSLCMADRQRNGVKSFVNSVRCNGKKPVKTNPFDQIMEMQALL